MWTMNHHSSAVTIEKDGPSLDAEYEFRNDKTLCLFSRYYLETRETRLCPFNFTQKSS